MVQFIRITEDIAYKIERVKESESLLTRYVFAVTQCRVSPSGEYIESKIPLKMLKNMSEVDRFIEHKTKLAKGNNKNEYIN